MSYAVLFKIYFWNYFVERQLQRLRARIGSGELCIMVDETRSAVGALDHDFVIRVKESDLAAHGLAAGVSGRSLFWYNADYSLYLLYEARPEFDYYVTVEYDAVINCDVDDLVGKAAAGGSDFVGRRTVKTGADWAWGRTASEIYPPDRIVPYLNMIAIYSRRATRRLLEGRRRLSERLAAGELKRWPISEAYVASEVAAAGFALGDLSDYGDVSHLAWWPPYPESELPQLGGCTFIHPVLEGEGYWTSLLRPDRLETIFDAGSFLEAKLRSTPPSRYLPSVMPALINRRRRGGPKFELSEIRESLCALEEPGRNIAIGKRATQSSTSPYSRHPSVHLDAGGAVNGVVTGTFGFHTGLDAPAWWMIDLEQPHRIKEIRVFNRLDVPGRARTIRIFLSDSGRTWDEAYRHDSERPFGGAYGEPLCVAFREPPIARFARIELIGRQYLHLDQVQIFGEPE